METTKHDGTGYRLSVRYLDIDGEAVSVWEGGERGGAVSIGEDWIMSPCCVDDYAVYALRLVFSGSRRVLFASESARDAATFAARRYEWA